MHWYYMVIIGALIETILAEHLLHKTVQETSTSFMRKGLPALIVLMVNPVVNVWLVDASHGTSAVTSKYVPAAVTTLCALYVMSALRKGSMRGLWSPVLLAILVNGGMIVLTLQGTFLQGILPHTH